MKSVKTSLLRKYNSLICIILSLLGFTTACSLIQTEYGTPATEYGTPHATFIVKGSVKSESASTSVQGIRVVMGSDSTYSDASGKYEVNVSAFPEDQTFTLKFKDVDGSANGAFQNQETTVTFTDPTFTGGSGWYEGETEKALDIKLKSKE
jgi:putative lipoprotein (rSAM/lipoprotein system)